ncbi:MAG: dihydropteroate synthase [Nannocystaceae bacterium]
MPERPDIFGIVNITEDSFSDGGLYLDHHRAADHAIALVEAGATVVDLGPASSHPDARRVPAQEEIRRLEPVIARLHSVGIPVSVDAYLPETQSYALGQGVAYLNDIRGFPDAAIYGELARASCGLVVMHSVQRGPASYVRVDPKTVWSRIFDFFDERVHTLSAAGIASERLILDPGMGFFLGDTPEPSLRVLARIGELKRRYGLATLVSVSRKSFLRHVAGRETTAVGAATLAAELYAVRAGVEFVRTHDVAALRDACRVWSSLSVETGL